MRFSGHESFHCRHFWLKKGYDYLNNGGNMQSEDSTSILGVGKNMVASINYWLFAFNIRDKANLLTPLGEYLFGDDGKDPYLEDKGSLWILQYLLVNSGIASIYSLVFKIFRKKHLNSQFPLPQIQSDVKRELVKHGHKIAEQTIEKDIRVFLKTYYVTTQKGKLNEDDLSSLLIDLELIEKVESNQDGENHITYKIRVTDRKEIPVEIIAFFLLYSIDDEIQDDISLSFDEILLNTADSIACNRDGLEQHIQSLQEKYDWIVYKEDAGRREIQIKTNRPTAFMILNEYYG